MTKPIEIPSPVPNARAFMFGECRILLAIENRLWHMSISHPNRYPTWDEIYDARYVLIPNKYTMAMLLPPKEQYVNVHPNCFHLWEVNDQRENGIIVLK